MIQIRQNNTWETIHSTFVKVGDSWRKCVGVYVKVGNDWECVLDNKVRKLPLLKVATEVHDVRSCAA